MIIIPTYNEEDNIEKIITMILNSYNNQKILVVDGFSTDNTRSILLKLKEKYKDLFLLFEDKRTNLGPSYIDAFKFVLTNCYNEKNIITLDADLSHPIEKIGDMINLLNNYDLVIGSRYVDGGNISEWTIKRRLISLFGNLYSRFFLHLNIKDLTAGFVGYNIDVLKKVDLNSVKTDGYGFQIEMKYFFSKKTNKIFEFPILFKDRIDGSSKFSKKIFLQAVFVPIRLFFLNLFNK